MERRAAALTAALSLAALVPACGGDPAGAAASGSTSGSGACDGGSCGGAGAGGAGGSGAGEPTCRGTPIPRGDLAVEPDGRTIAIDCGDVVLRASVLESGLLRLRYQGSTPPAARASYAVVEQAAVDPHARFGTDGERALVCTDDFLLRIDRETCLLDLVDANGAEIVADPPGGGYLERGGGERRVLRTATPDERFYGFGEKTGPLDRRGRVLTFWNTDAYQAAFGGYPPDADPLYQSIPFFVGLRGAVAYGVFLDDTHRLRFDMAATDPSAYELSAEGGEIDQYILAGPRIADVVERFTHLTGRAPIPPRWSLGYHQSRWGYFPDAAVTGIAEEFRARKIPVDGLWLDIQHMDGFRSFTWDPVGFPDPSGLVQGLAALGVKTIAIVDPAIKQDPGWDVYDSGLAGGHFLSQGGAPYVGEVWPGKAVFPDFSSPETRAWWGSLVPRTLGAGVRGLWIDMNEPSSFTEGASGSVPNDVPAAGDGVAGTMAELHNVYALNEARATYDGMRAAAPDRRPFVLTRAGYAGVQRYAAVWTGDAPSTWATLEGTLPMMLGMGLSGLPFVGSDVGGYSGFASPALFARWIELGAISPFFRGHVATNTNDQEPWQFGTEVEDISRAAITARYRLLPYLYSLADEASRTGAPILRPLVYEFQDDPVTHALSDEAMLGPFLLCAPVLADGAAQRSVYLPPGRWFEERSGAIHDGPATIDVGVTLAALPTFVREGAIVPRAQAMAWSDAEPISPLSLDVYPSAAPSSFTLYEDDGGSFAYAAGASSRVTFTLEGKAGGAVLRAGARDGSFVPPARTLVVRVRRVDHGVTGVRLGGQPLAARASAAELDASGSGYWYDERDLSLVIAILDQPGFELAMDYDPAIDELAPAVMMPFRIQVPPGTPAAPPVHIATSASGWTHQPLDWDPGMETASGLVSVPRGDWVFYKYTRGGWSTVEKWPGCAEATNRYELGAAFPEKIDTVWAWADQCP